jgi:hypothetical protein
MSSMSELELTSSDEKQQADAESEEPEGEAPKVQQFVSESRDDGVQNDTLTRNRRQTSFAQIVLGSSYEKSLFLVNLLLHEGQFCRMAQSSL